MRLSEKINGSKTSLFESSFNQAMNETEVLEESKKEVCPECGKEKCVCEVEKPEEKIEEVDEISGNELNEDSDKVDLANLAEEIFDWYDNDMGTHFDEVKGNEEEVYQNILAVLEHKDEESINLFIKDIEDSGLDQDRDLVKKLKALLIVEESEVLEESSIAIFKKGSSEYENLEAVASKLNELAKEREINFTYEVKDILFDAGQNWYWTTVVCYSENPNEITGRWQALTPAQQEKVIAGRIDEVAEEVINRDSKYA